MNGDPADILSRLKRYLPRWFGQSPRPTPILDSVLSGPAAGLSAINDLYVYAKAQTRLATATGGWLDLAAADFFGDRLPRWRGDSDAAYALRLRREVFRKRVTRDAVTSIVEDITGNTPHVFEGWVPSICGGYGTPGLAFGRAGRWGSTTAPFEVIISMPLPQGYGIPRRGGWGSMTGGYGVGNFSFASETLITGTGPTQTEILRAIDSVRAAGVRYLVRFVSVLGDDSSDEIPPPPPYDPNLPPPDRFDPEDGLLDFNFESGAGLIPFIA